MALATLQKIERRFGEFDVLLGAGLQVEVGDRIGIVGDNGSGKTTLIRILAGVDEPDRGSRQLRRGLRIAYAEQIPKLEAGTTVGEFVRRGDGTFGRLEQRIGDLEATLAERPDDEKALAEYGELQGAFEAGGGYDRDHLCERVLSGIGFDVAAWDKDCSVLSGGEKSRLVLASLMTAPADLLILDEPTNHLDLDGISFVEDFVQRYPGAVAVVSHDVRFLNATARRIVEVDGGTATSWKGNFDAWRKQRDERLLAEARAHKSQAAFIEKEMEYIRRNMAGRMSRQAKGRLKRLQRLEVLSKPKGERGGMKLTFADKVRGQSGQTMLEAVGVTLKIGDRELIRDASFRLNHGETIGLVGRNGTGKSTLIDALVGVRPVGAGKIEKAHGVRIGTFRQDVTHLPGELTVFEALRQVDPEATDKEIRDHLALFLFSGDDVDARVGDLSGGEKQRVSLARLTRSHYDLLCLDEPTNHLDISAREGLGDALRAFPGAIVLVSHDRELLARQTDRILYLENGTLRSFDGGLDACMAQVAAERSQRRAAEAAQKERERAAEQRAAPAAAASATAKIRNPMMFEKLEAQIMELETELESVRSSMQEEAAWRDAARMKQLQEREATLDAELTECYERWENWS